MTPLKVTDAANAGALNGSGSSTFADQHFAIRPRRKTERRTFGTRLGVTPEYLLCLFYQR